MSPWHNKHEYLYPRALWEAEPLLQMFWLYPSPDMAVVFHICRVFPELSPR